MEYEKVIADEMLNFGEILCTITLKSGRWYHVYFKFSHYLVCFEDESIIRKQDDYIGFCDILTEMLLMKFRSKR